MSDHGDRLQVRTPEGVSFAFALASPVTRLAAWVVDKAVVMAAWMIISALIMLGGWINSDLTRGLLAAGFFVLSLGYGISTEWLWDGQTLGKRLLRLRVMDERGLPLSPSQVVIRNLLRAVDVLPGAYLVGGIVALLNRKVQRLGDLAAATIVVNEERSSGPNLAGLGLAKFNSLRGQLHIAARLRAKTSPALAHAALAALQRRDQFDDAVRVRLFHDLSEHFRLAGAIPPDLVEGISDEQLVRNAVELLYNQRPAGPGAKA